MTIAKCSDLARAKIRIAVVIESTLPDIQWVLATKEGFCTKRCPCQEMKPLDISSQFLTASTLTATEEEEHLTFRRER